MTQKNLPHFETPPVNEVAMGVRFVPIEGLHLAHFGLFWSLLRTKFGRSEEAVPLGTIDDLIMSKVGGPLPRIWLIHNDEQYLIQLQPNIFYFNWRRREDTGEYPRYATIKPLFHDYFHQFLEFLTREQLPNPKAANCELTYVNLIPESQIGGSIDGIGGMIPNLSWKQLKDRYLQAPNSINWQTTFDRPDDAGELTIKIQSAKRVADDVSYLRFEISARSVGSKLPLDTLENWFDLAHEAIVLSFVDLTSIEMQRDVWNRVDGAN